MGEAEGDFSGVQLDARAGMRRCEWFAVEF
jgi:hypothetical protein